MKVLALDTATSACSAAVWEDGVVRARRLVMIERGQSEALMPMVRDVMSEAGEVFSDLDLLAVTVGPGAFTGLRIGLASARGLSLATGLPCVGVTTLEAVAHGIGVDERADRFVLVALESKRADLYAQVFDRTLDPIGSPQALSPEEVSALAPAGPLIVVGDGAERAVQALTQASSRASGNRPLISTALGVPDAAVVAALAAGRFRPADDSPPPPAPLYLRPPDATLPRNGGRRRP